MNAADLYTQTPSGLTVPKTAVAAQPVFQRQPMTRQVRRLIARRGAPPKCRSKLDDGSICGRPISANKPQCKRCADSQQALVDRAAAAGLVLAR